MTCETVVVMCCLCWRFRGVLNATSFRAAMKAWARAQFPWSSTAVQWRAFIAEDVAAAVQQQQQQQSVARSASDDALQAACPPSWTCL